MSKRLIKLARALQQKKHRKEEKAFLAEGEKNVVELLHSESFKVRALLFSESFYRKYPKLCDKVADKSQISESELTSASSFETNTDAIAIADLPEYPLPSIEELSKQELVLLLDQIRDPGNLGTIIRLADWYGLNSVICSPDCVDSFNPKTIAASMGSFLRIKVFYTDLKAILAQAKNCFGAFLEGENIHKTELPKNAFLVIGSESHGISEEVGKFIQRKITIPKFGNAESLNAAMATAVILDNFKRR
jgi:TrmH family RNA methyltransferase